MAAARNNYRQVRVTITEETRGRMSVRVLVKPPEAPWSIRHTVWSHTWSAGAPTPHWSDLVLEALREVSEARVLPPD